MNSENFSLIRELRKLDLNHQILFATSICERTLLVYANTNVGEGFNHTSLPILTEILDYIWNFPATGVFDRDKLQDSLDACGKITFEIQENQLGVFAEYTSPYMIYSTLELCLIDKTRNLKNIVQCGYSMLSDLLSCLMEEEEKLAENDQWSSKSSKEQLEIIDNHYYTNREVQKQKDDWKLLANTPLITAEFIQNFRYNATPGGCGIVDFKIEH
jgi:Protein of unknown function (DUF416)